VPACVALRCYDRVGDGYSPEGCLVVHASPRSLALRNSALASGGTIPSAMCRSAQAARSEQPACSIGRMETCKFPYERIAAGAAAVREAYTALVVRDTLGRRPSPLRSYGPASAFHAAAE
jgi:hypothetical protein